MNDIIDISQILSNVLTFLIYAILLYFFINMIYNIVKPFYFSTFGSKFDVGRSGYVGFEIHIRTDEAIDDCHIKGKYTGNKLTNIEIKGDGDKCTKLRNNNKL